jgi:hypothetical protein
MNFKAELIRLKEDFEASRNLKDPGEINKVQCKIVSQLDELISDIDNKIFSSFRVATEPEEYIDVDFFAAGATNGVVSGPAGGDGFVGNVAGSKHHFFDQPEKFLEKAIDCDAMGNRITYESCIKLQCGAVAIAYAEQCQSYYLEEIERLKSAVEQEAPEPLNGWYLVRYESALGRISEIPAQLRDKQWFSTEFSGIPLTQAVIISPVLVKY